MTSPQLLMFLARGKSPASTRKVPSGRSAGSAEILADCQTSDKTQRFGHIALWLLALVFQIASAKNWLRKMSICAEPVTGR